MLYDSEVEVYINRKQSLKSDTGVIGMNPSVQSSKIHKKTTDKSSSLCHKKEYKEMSYIGGVKL